MLKSTLPKGVKPTKITYVQNYVVYINQHVLKNLCGILFETNSVHYFIAFIVQPINEINNDAKTVFFLTLNDTQVFHIDRCVVNNIQNLRNWLHRLMLNNPQIPLAVCNHFYNDYCSAYNSVTSQTQHLK